MEKYEFDMETFVTCTEEQDIKLCAETQNELTAIREHYPELAHWSRFAFFVAWGPTHRIFMPSVGCTG
ncbi:hypothetical protein CBH79_23405 [Salmonella enterica]|nr:hypothetical protein [Salmonella enterica]